MTRLLLITLLVLSSGPAYAEWVEADRYDQAGMTVYADPDTIRRKGDLVKMWVLIDFKTIQTSPSGTSYLSSKQQREYDCAKERQHMLVVTVFLGNMGSGKVVFNNSDEQVWEPVAPESTAQGLWKIACGKK